MRGLTGSLGQRLRAESRRMLDLRSWDPKALRSRLRGPTAVQIQTVDRCNGRCIMCPYASVARSAPANAMEDGLYRRLLDEIRRIGTVRTLLLMLQNEPLLDGRLPDMARLAKESLGQSVRVTAVTNGTLLTSAMIDSLAGSGIDRVSVSIDAVCQRTYDRVRHGLDFRRVVENTISLIERLGPRRVGVKFLRQRENEGEEREFLDYWRRHGVWVSFTEPTNRAGRLDSYQRIRRQRPVAWKRWFYPLINLMVPVCPLPFSSMPILWDGRVILCCNDWGPNDTVGDLSRQSLGEVWAGEKLNHYRNLLWTRRATESLVCAGCSLSDRFWKV